MAKRQAIRALVLAVSLAAAGLLSSPPARALSLSCTQGGLKSGCQYEVWYNDGTHETQTADGSGRIRRPCSRIIVNIVAYPCSLAQFESPPET